MEAIGRQRGVHAIELALATAATAVIATLGVSMHQTHYVRAQVAATVEEAEAARPLIVAAFRSNGALPQDAAAAGIDESAHRLLLGSYLDSLEVHDGRLDLRFGPTAYAAIAGQTLSLTPFETVERSVVWICGKQAPSVGLQPLGFAEGGSRTAQTTTSIENRYLPSSCR
jgi:hypothetical protein